MTYSCTDFTDDVLNNLLNLGWIDGAQVEEDDPEAQANLVLGAIINADPKLTRFSAAQQFYAELLESVETIGGIADQHGAMTLANVLYLHAAILNGTSIELYPTEATRLSFVRRLPSGQRWWQSVVEMSDDRLAAPRRTT